MQQLKITNKQKSLSLVHINSCSLNKKFVELQNLLQSANIHFDVIAITETLIPKSFSATHIIVLNSYSFECTPTEPFAGGAQFFI